METPVPLPCRWPLRWPRFPLASKLAPCHSRCPAALCPDYPRAEVRAAATSREQGSRWRFRSNMTATVLRITRRR